MIVELLQDVELSQDVELLQDVEHLQGIFCISKSDLRFLKACSARFKVGLNYLILVLRYNLNTIAYVI